jgi:hypothetical protein
MKIQLEKTFDDYVKSASETAETLLSRDSAAVRGFRLFHDYFGQVVWADGAVVPPTSSVLTMNAYLLFLSGAHAALQGHAAAVFPLLRTALENACYAFMIAKNPDLADVWMHRHQDEASRRASRATFTPAVRETALAISALQPESGDIVLECYESAIDFGSHPNPRGVLEHLSFGEPDEDGQVTLSLTALHGPDDFGTKHVLIACLDFAWVIGLVMARTRPELTKEIVDALAALNAAKADAIHEFGLADRS